MADHFPPQVTVDGIQDEARGVEYWGVAERQPNGRYHCLAAVNGCLCVVEVRLSERTGDAEGGTSG